MGTHRLHKMLVGKLTFMEYKNSSDPWLFLSSKIEGDHEWIMDWHSFSTQENILR